MIIVNLTDHIINHEKMVILPGSNIVEKFNENHFVIKSMIEEGYLKIIADPAKASVAEKNEALKHSTSAKVLVELNDLFNASENKVLSKTSKAKKKEIEDFEKSLEKKKED